MSPTSPTTSTTAPPSPGDMGASMRWDLTSFFPSFDSDERARFEAELARDVDALFAAVGALGPSLFRPP
jgi:hypothetical protein